MEEAKAAVRSHISRAGKHDTSVYETVAEGVTHENITPTKHETVQTAVDREVHQHHYHTSVQPITDRKVLPEEHTHNLVEVEHRTIHHDDPKETEEKLAAVSDQFQDKTVRGETKHTHSVAPIVSGEHVHHHVHEVIQPVVHRETIHPQVVHTTVPIHEVHHNAAQHHSTSALPAMSMEDFKKQGGTLNGREERYDGFEGEPKNVGGALAAESRFRQAEPTAI